MTDTQIDGPRQRPLRLWPGVVIVVLQWLVRFGLPVVWAEGMAYGVLGGLAGGLLIVVWWLFFSRAPWSERLGAVALMALAMVAARPLLHESIAQGAMGMLYFILSVPMLSLALVVWAAFSRRLATGPRWAALAAVLLLAAGSWALVRTGGFTGNFDNEFAWRWSQTPEDRLLAQAAEEPLAPPPPAAPVAPAAPAEELAAQDAGQESAVSEPAAEAAAEQPSGDEAPADDGPAQETAGASVATSNAEPVPAPAPAAKTPAWPGFRGPHRDGTVSGVRIATDWSASPPTEVWRRAVGPGWSSFAVVGDFIYTQEQRGEEEVVSCYRAATGDPVWRHGDPARFWESNAGAGPRGTPTVSGARVYTFGATGLVNALDARTGAVIWSRNAAEDTGAELPTWGFSSSPLVVGDVVLVAASGDLVAYDATTGEPRWFGPEGGASYSSPQLVTIDGVEQVLVLHEKGAASVDPADGTVLWEHPWPGYPIVQPALTADGDVLLSVTEQSGTRRLAVDHGPAGWTVEERWTSIGLKSYFNDFVVHEGHAYGFDGRILAAIDLETGERKWKGGRYGSGQLVLLPEQDLLLVISELGELALVSATPEGFQEVARFPAIEGKTWNHPVLAGDLLLVRNDREMAAFRLALAGSPAR